MAWLFWRSPKPEPIATPIPNNQQHHIRNATPAIDRCLKKLLKAENEMLRVRLQVVNEIRVELERIERCMKKQETPFD